RRHGRVHAVGARLVARRHHDRARAAPGDDDGFAAQARIVTLLHGSVERIHVHMNDLAHGLRHGGPRKGFEASLVRLVCVSLVQSNPVGAVVAEIEFARMQYFGDDFGGLDQSWTGTVEKVMPVDDVYASVLHSAKRTPFGSV